MKHTVDSKVDLLLSYDKASKCYELQTIDYGSGVPELLLIGFDPFLGAIDRAQQHGGYGLGLAIAQRAIVAHMVKFLQIIMWTSGLVVTIKLPYDPLVKLDSVE